MTYHSLWPIHLSGGPCPTNQDSQMVTFLLRKRVASSGEIGNHPPATHAVESYPIESYNRTFRGSIFAESNRQMPWRWHGFRWLFLALRRDNLTRCQTMAVSNHQQVNNLQVLLWFCSSSYVPFGLGSIAGRRQKLGVRSSTFHHLPMQSYHTIRNLLQRSFLKLLSLPC